MKDVKWEYGVFAALFAAFLGMEMFAVKTKKIEPASNLIWWLDRGEISHHVLAGAWAGFCVWTWRHWFIRNNDI